MLQVHSLQRNDSFYAAGDTRQKRTGCSADAANALQEHGFCLVQTEVGLSEEAMDVAEERRFGLSPMTKSFMSQSAEEGYSAGQHKEMFHFTSQSGSVQSPSYCYIPTAPGDCFRTMKDLPKVFFNGINAHVLNLLRLEQFDHHPFVNPDDYSAWLNAVDASSEHVMSSFCYHQSNPNALHVDAHVDKGVLSICTNPNDLEICVNGTWTPLGPQPDGTVVVLCGYTLERATGGVFRAARHRVRNNGERRSRVLKLRFNSALQIHPSFVIANVQGSLRDDVPDPPDCLQVGELMEAFAQMHNSVNQPDTALLSASGVPNAITEPLQKVGHGLSMGDNLDRLPSILVYQIVDWLRDLRDLARLGRTCQALHVIANAEAVCIPAAEAMRIDWGAALDRIDRGVLSHVRCKEEVRKMEVKLRKFYLVASVWISNYWNLGHSLLGSVAIPTGATGMDTAAPLAEAYAAMSRIRNDSIIAMEE